MEAHEERTSVWHPDDGITASTIASWMQCPWKMHWGVALGYAPVASPSPAIHVGRLVHEMLSELHEKGSIPDITPSSPEEAMALAMAHYYERSFFKDHKFRETEKEFVVRDEYALLRGRFDGITSSGLIVEVKTRRGEPPDPDVVANQPQTLLYIRAYYLLHTRQECTGMQYLFLRRPSIRLRQQESLESFYDRVLADLEEEGRGLTSIYVQRNAYEVGCQLRRIVRELRRDYDGMVGDDRTPPPARRTTSCEAPWGKCPYLRLCWRGDTTGLHRVGPMPELDIVDATE